MRMIARGEVLEGDFKGQAVIGRRKNLRLVVEGNSFDILFDREITVRYLERKNIVNWEFAESRKKNWKDWIWKGIDILAFIGNPIAYTHFYSENVYWIWVEFWDGKKSLIEIGETQYQTFLYQMEYGCDED